MGDLLSVSDALEHLLAAFCPTDFEYISLAQAFGRILAVDVHADTYYPLFDNSSMDGFAVRSMDISSASRQNPVALTVVGDIPAGHVSSVSVQHGQAARIMTGALLPDGADAVVPVEDTDFSTRDPSVALPSQVLISSSVDAGAYVRPCGQDMHPGDLLMDAGHRLRSQDVGMLATIGISDVIVHRCPQVAILATGDELLPVEEPLRPGTIRESNSYMLAAQIQSCGATPFYLGIVPDHPESVQEALAQATSLGVDMILSSAGVSVGAFDFVRQVVQQHGQLDFWRVNMRPGKPLTFGSYQQIPFIGLPGNPVSTFVSFEVFVRRALYKLAGVRNWQRPVLDVELAQPIQSDGRESYLRAVISWQDGRWLAKLTGHQGSGNLRSLIQANALLIIPSEVKSLPTGGRVAAWWLVDESSSNQINSNS